ncbi:MAG: hypothetical protein K1X78_15230 [Verrucomicrobiaceae bacterium]|nr:hypothetical protein [Verrucomicrobiaceae bacterium]
MNPNLEEATHRIRFCHRKRRNHLNLAELGLTTAELDAIPEFAKLTQLEFLDLTGNELTELPRGLSAFTRLRWLGLNFNRVISIDGVEHLTLLERLYLRGNALRTLPAGIGALAKLVELDLNANRVEELPGSFARLFEGEGRSAKVWPHVDFGGNPAEFLRLYKANDPTAFLAELAAQAKKRAVVREGKLLLVGEGEVGKSTLLRALRGESFRRAEAEKLRQTQGVELAPLPLPLGAVEPEVTLNAWDFSGQDPVRDTHQIFFTQPAIYLLVFKARTGTGVQTLIDWLWLIKHRTKSHAKVLIVGTEVGAGRAQVDDLDRVWRLFGGPDGMLIEEGIHFVECDEKHQGGQTGINELRKKLLRVVNDTPGFCQIVSQAMLEVRQRVDEERKKQHFMDWQAFEDVCHQQGRGIQREHVAAFARQQHEIGRLVWIERGILAQKVILAPDWLGKALAYLFQPRQDGTEAALGGIATQGQIDAEWRLPRRFGTEGQIEPPLEERMFPIFRAFMAEYDLWHPVDPETRGDARRYLIPKLFAQERRAWDAAWDALGPLGGSLKRQVQLNGWDGEPLNTWLMRAFFSRLIVRLYPQLLDTGNAAPETHWRHGFRLHEDHLGHGRVWFDKDRGRVFFDAVGNKPDWLWCSLRGAIDGLRHEMAAPGTEMEIEVDKYVPCTAAVPDCQLQLAAFAEADVLSWQNDEELGPRIKCVEKGCPHKLSIALLAEGIDSPRGGAVCQRDEELHSKMDSLLESSHRLEAGMDTFWQQMETGFESFRNTLKAVAAGTEATADQLALVSMVVADVKAELLQLTCRLDDPHRLGPCLFFVEPVDPDFWKDPGRLFGSKFCLQLCCERTLLPVSWFRSTPNLGRFDFTMDEKWWSLTKPYLKGVTRLLAAFVPGAGLLGHSADISSLIDLSESDILKQGKDLLDNTEKLLELPDATVDASPAARQTRKAPYGVPDLTEARGLDLKKLHSFLLGQTKQPSLETANLGLVRRYDKGQRRHLWVHESQQGYYGDPRDE